MIEASDIARNRGEPKWTRREQVARMLWGCAHLAFRATPRPCWGFRRGLLRLFGAHIGRDVRIHPSAAIWMPWNLVIGDGAAVGDRVILYALGVISIGRAATISQGAHICGGSHDHRVRHMPLTKATVRIHEGAWICADAFVGPDTEVGAYAIVGARAVVVKDVPAWTIVAGNPAQHLSARPSFAND